MLTPQIMPRLNSFFQSGFTQLAYFMALVFSAVKILPRNHIYLQSSSVGRYGLHNVWTEAASHLKFSTKNIDQIIIFFALIAGMIILVIQFLLLMMAMFTGSARAAAGFQPPPGFDQFFVTQNPQDDLALRMLDQVFGIPDFFNSQDAGELPFHTSLHGLFQFYSFALIVIGAVILVYFVFAIVAETAQTGTPFGKRYNHVWVPIRLIAAFGLLIPVQFGFNSAQWITLYAAKFGSAFATNGWLEFNNTLNAETYVETPEELIATPKVPANLRDIAAFMSEAVGCQVAYIIRTEGPNFIDVQGYLVRKENGGDAIDFTPNYQAALDHFDNGDIHIRFGHLSEQYHKTSGVYPYCGEIVIPVTDVNEPGTQIMNEAYYNLIHQIWTVGIAGLKFEATQIVTKRLEHNQIDDPPSGFKDGVVEAMEQVIFDAIEQAVVAQRQNIVIDPVYLTYGWGGAAIWYNKIAQLNGSMISAVQNTPNIKLRPSTMEFAKYKNIQETFNLTETAEFDWGSSKGKNDIPTNAMDEQIGQALNDIHVFWVGDEDDTTHNIIIDTINLLFGTVGLFDMCENEDIHPLAQISGLGKSLLETAMRNIGLGLFGGAIGLAGIGPATAMSSFLMSIASFTIMIGFILFYVVPFLPFLYFFFAVGGWVKGIFEAMVGVPLWALAHLRIDGNGLAGEAALNGYFLIFEIFLRPILIVFGLLASILIFGAMVTILHDIFYIVVSNLSGFDAEDLTLCGTTVTGDPQMGDLEYFRGPIDELCFTIIYAILVYMIGMSCFKLIDLIPNQILRWMGHGVSTFNDQAGEPAEGLSSRIAIGGSVMGGQLQGAFGKGGFAGAAGSLAKAANQAK